MSGINGLGPNPWGGYGFNQQPAPQPNAFSKFLPNQPLPNAGFNPMPFPNMGFPMPYFPQPDFGGKGGYEVIGKGGKDGKGGAIGDGASAAAELSGRGSIRGNSFKTADGERWEPAVKAGETYNLLSDGGVGVNGTYATKGGETVLDKIGMKVGGSTITLASDGTFKIDGKEFKKGKNDLDGAVSVKNGTITITSDEGYTFKLKASESAGISVDIEAKDVAADGVKPDGLWGVAFDGEKQTASDLKKDIRPRDYKIADALTFDYEDNNALTDTDTLDDETRNERLFNSRNPVREYQNNGLSNVGAFFNMSNRFDGGRGKGNQLTVWDGVTNGNPNDWRRDDISWKQENLRAGKFYNLFSDEDIQVNAKMGSDKLPEQLGIQVNGRELKIEETASGMKVSIDGEAVTSFDSDGIKLENGVLTIKSDGEETYNMTITQENGGLSFNMTGKNFGANSTRSTGLLGDAMGAGIDRDSGSNDVDGAGYLRDEDGALTRAGQNMNDALRGYLVDDLFDTESGRSVFDR